MNRWRRISRAAVVAAALFSLFALTACEGMKRYPYRVAITPPRPHPYYEQQANTPSPSAAPERPADAAESTGEEVEPPGEIWVEIEGQWFLYRYVPRPPQQENPES